MTSPRPTAAALADAVEAFLLDPGTYVRPHGGGTLTLDGEFTPTDPTVAAWVDAVVARRPPR